MWHHVYMRRTPATVKQTIYISDLLAKQGERPEYVPSLVNGPARDLRGRRVADLSVAEASILIGALK